MKSQHKNRTEEEQHRVCQRESEEYQSSQILITD